MHGPVVQAFAYDETHPYASGQHRGIDIGADAVGETVSAPAAGRVSFAGTVPTSGKSVTIETPDGYSVTLTHLGSPAMAESTPQASTRGSTVRTSSARASRHGRGRAPASRVEPRWHRSAQLPATHAETAGAGASHHGATPRRRVSAPTSSTRRPVVEAAAPREPTALDAGHEMRPAQAGRPQPGASAALLPLVCNGAAAVVALAAALAAARRRRRDPPARIVGAEVLHLPQPAVERRAA